MRYRILIILISITACSENHIIQRAANEYFLYQEGNWWRYAAGSETMLVEIEPPDTLLQTEVFPITLGGNVKYLWKNNRGIYEYIRIIYNIAGHDYVVTENFIKRIELPLIDGNTYHDSLVDSLEIFGDLVKARVRIDGSVNRFDGSEFGGSNWDEGYKIAITEIFQLVAPDTSIIDTSTVEECYVPEQGMVRFSDNGSWYDLVEYYIQ